MTVTVRLFAGAADAIAPRVDVDVDTPTTAGGVRDALLAAHPEHTGLITQCRLAVNLEIAEATTPVDDGDEVALLPPFAGGAVEQPGTLEPVVLVDVREPPLPVDDTLAAITAPAAGAQVVFLGRVRDHSPQRPEVVRLEYSVYEPMARRELETIATEALDAWPSLRGVALLHAVGSLPVGAPTVLVACSSPHRDDAYAANRHLLEELKARAPVWKREVTPDGAHWVGLEPPRPHPGR